jgi:hypothetical protein
VLIQIVPYSFHDTSNQHRERERERERERDREREREREIIGEYQFVSSSFLSGKAVKILVNFYRLPNIEMPYLKLAFKYRELKSGHYNWTVSWESKSNYI